MLSYARILNFAKPWFLLVQYFFSPPWDTTEEELGRAGEGGLGPQQAFFEIAS